MNGSFGLEPEDCYATALRRAARRLSLAYDRALADCGLNTGQFAILAALNAGPADGMSVGALAARLSLDAAGLTHTLKPLIRDGLACLRDHPADRRAKLVLLTERGGAALQAAAQAWRLAQAAFEGRFGLRQAAALRALATAAADLDTGSTPTERNPSHDLPELERKDDTGERGRLRSCRSQPGDTGD